MNVEYPVVPATAADLEGIEQIFAQARKFMASCGNPQWSDGYPYPQVIAQRVERGQMFKIVCGEDIAAVFSVLESDGDYDDNSTLWRTERGQYLAVHTVAVNQLFRGRGYARAVFSAAENMAKSLGKLSLRIDTHEKNAPMRSALRAFGFAERGGILLGGSQPRIAYEKLL